MVDPKETSNQNVLPFEQVSGAYNDVVRHNNSHTGFGGLLSAVLEGALERAEPIDANNEASAVYIYKKIGDKLDENVVEGEMDAELQDMFHADLFMRVGLKILPSGSHMEDGNGKRASSDRLNPYVENTQLFADFLKSTSPEDAQTEAGSELLIGVAISLDRIIEDFLGKDGNQQHPELEQTISKEIGENALRSWDELADEYKRLGFSSDVLREKLAHADMKDVSRYKRQLHIIGGLEQYVDYWGHGLLPEFIEAWGKGYITQEEEFYYWAPARWAEDMLPDELSTKWEESMDFVEKLKDKEGAHELLQLVRSNLELALDSSHKRMQEGEISGAEHYEKAAQDWKDHGEENYEDVDQDGYNHTVHEPQDSSTYFRNNRIALEAAKLRFQQL